LGVGAWFSRGNFLIFRPHKKKLQPETVSDYLIY
jgi:hypothetical protein